MEKLLLRRKHWQNYSIHQEALFWSHQPSGYLSYWSSELCKKEPIISSNLILWRLQRICQISWAWLQWTLGSLWWLLHQWLNSSESCLAPVTIHSTIPWKVPIPSRFQTKYYSSHSTNHCAMNSSPEKQGDKSLFMNSDRYCSSNSAPVELFSLLFTFGWKEIHPW